MSNEEDDRNTEMEMTEIDGDMGENEVDFDSLSFEDAMSVGLAFEQFESPESAVPAFRRAVALNATHYQARKHLAEALMAQDDMATAMEHLLVASELPEANDDGALWLSLGMSETELGQPVKAQEHLEKARNLALAALKHSDDEHRDELQSDYGMALAALAQCLGDAQGRVEAAVRVYQDAVKEFPNDANLHYNLAMMWQAQSDREQAKKSLETAIRLDKDVAEYYEALLECLDEGDAARAEVERKLKALRSPDEQES